MTLGMTLINPMQSRVVTRRTRLTRLTRCAYQMFCDGAGLFRDTGILFLGIFSGLKTFPETRKPPRKSGNIPPNAKTKIRLITTLRYESAVSCLLTRVASPVFERYNSINKRPFGMLSVQVYDSRYGYPRRVTS